jgi:hypothetical protein
MTEHRECLEMAKRLDRPEDRQTLEQLAKAWEKLADLRGREIKLPGRGRAGV